MADDPTPAEPVDTDPAPEPTPPAKDDDKPLGEAGERALAQERDARKAAEKELKSLRKEIDEIRQSSMSEAEKQVAEAEARGRAEAQTHFGSRLVRSEFVAAAAKRNPGFDAAAVLDDLNLTKFVNDDGEPDAKAIASAVERLIPAENGLPSFDGGSRTPAATATGMNGLIRKATGRA